MDSSSALAQVLARAVQSVPRVLTSSLDLYSWFGEDKREANNATALLHSMVRHDQQLQHHYIGDDGVPDPAPVLAFQYAVWLLNRARLLGVEQALHEYEQLKSASDRGYHSIVVLRRLKVETSQDLGRGVFLVPWTSVPVTAAKELFSSASHATASPMHVQAALIVRWRESNVPFLSAAYLSEESRRSDVGLPLADALAAMTFGTDIVVDPVATYTHQDEDLPFPLSWSTYRAPDSGERAEWTEKHTATTQPIVQQLAAVSSDLRSSLLAVSRHLARTARAKEDPADACAALGIALETTFLTDKETSEMQYRLAIRAARFTGGREISNRQDVQKTVKRFYGLRSTAVHRGRLSNTQMKGDAHLDLIRRTAGVVRAAIHRALRDGGFPEWDKFDIAEAAPPSGNVSVSTQAAGLPD